MAMAYKNMDQETKAMREMKDKLHTGELYLPGDESIMRNRWHIKDDTHIYIGDDMQPIYHRL